MTIFADENTTDFFSTLRCPSRLLDSNLKFSIVNTKCFAHVLYAKRLPIVSSVYHRCMRYTESIRKRDYERNEVRCDCNWSGA